MADKVAPEPVGDENKNICYLKEFKKEALWGTGFTGAPWPEDYVAKRTALGVKFCPLPDGRKLCYWTEGDPRDVPVIALHGGCEGKYKWMQKQPIPGVYLIAIDRPHYGGSSPIPLTYTFKNAAEDIGHLAEHLNLDQFILMGHSVGTSWSQQIAAALPHRVRGAILFASMADPLHPESTTEVKLAVNYWPLSMCRPCGRMDCCCHPFSGCCGCLPRSIMKSLTGLVGKSDGIKHEARSKPSGQDMYEKFAADPFWVASMVDSWGAHHDGKAVLGDTKRSLCGKWTYETRDIKCPVYIFQGEGDVDCKVPVTTNYLAKLIPQAQVEIIPGTGHICTNGPNDWTQQRILKAVRGMPRLDGAPQQEAMKE